MFVGSRPHQQLSATIALIVNREILIEPSPKPDNEDLVIIDQDSFGKPDIPDSF